MILLVDNYDSFSYNLFQYIGEINPDVKVIRNDELTLNEIRDLAPTHIVLSPGPGFPRDAGICEEIILNLGKTIPILGVCLGHQAICEAFGMTITHAQTLVHGKMDYIYVSNGNPIFKGLPPMIEAARYHSLVADKSTLTDELLVTADDKSGEIMGVCHREYNIYGVQFHPESILTPNGKTIIGNFLSLGGGIR